MFIQQLLHLAVKYYKMFDKRQLYRYIFIDGGASISQKAKPNAIQHLIYQNISESCKYPNLQSLNKGGGVGLDPWYHDIFQHTNTRCNSSNLQTRASPADTTTRDTPFTPWDLGGAQIHRVDFTPLTPKPGSAPE